MNAIDIMVDEHKNIKKMLVITRKYCSMLLNNEAFDLNVFNEIIDFIRNYADKHHHGKEEEMLFNKMEEECVEAIKKTIRYGMLVEHDMGRMYVRDLEEALKRYKDGDEDAKLDIIANAISYTHLLQRHIDKEDNILYKYAINNLSKDTLDKLDKESLEFEENAKKNGTQDKYIKLIEKLS